MNKKVVIIGAGVSGLTAGVYLLKAGFDVTIYEKHAIPGGLLTSWVRNGTTIDGCAHWIVGTSPRSDFYHVWQDLGVIKEDTKIYQTDYFNILEIDGKTVTFYADIVKLEQELMRIGPEDEKQIKKFIKAIKAYQVINPPADKPVKYFKFGELMRYGARMLPVLPRILKYYRISVQEFANKFKNPTLRKAFEVVVQPNYNLHSFIYIMQTLTKYDAGVIEGGSKKVSNDIYETFKSLGGNVVFNAEVDKIVINNKVAKSFILKNGKEVEFDYLIPAQDVHNLLYKNLDGKYMLYKFDKRFEDGSKFPLNTGVQICFRAKPNFNKIEKMYGFEVNDLDVGFKKLRMLKVRNHTFDRTLNQNSTLVTVLIDSDEKAYEYFQNFRKESEIAYKNEKNRIGELIRQTINKHFNLADDELELIDVTTPLTYERYTNAYHGSYMSFLATKYNRSLMSNGVIKGIKNMFLAGQWLMPPGGLPIALFTGKHAAYRVMRKEKIV